MPMKDGCVATLTCCDNVLAVHGVRIRGQAGRLHAYER